VQLWYDDEALHLSGANGFAESIHFWKLFRSLDGSTLVIRRLDRPGWELRLPGGGHADLKQLVGEKPLARVAGPLARFGGLKIAAGLVVMALTLWESAPARWTAGLLPRWAQDRMVDGYIQANARLRCNREGGEAAARKILTRLDPDIGASVEIVTLNVSNVMVTSLPGNRLLIMRGALGDIDYEALAALLAHELSHLRHDDATAAMVRYEGNSGTLKAILQGEDRREAFLQFSGPEEERADREAIAMMSRAGITMKPAAAMFHTMTIDQYFAPRQRDFHFGMAGRAKAWLRAASSEPPILRSVLTRDEADNLFNYCWPGRIKSYPASSPPAANSEMPFEPGTMQLGSDKHP
jgi:hypothetical protein